MATPAAVDRAVLKIDCAGPNAGAEITIGGDVKGDCPLEVQLAPGTVRIVARKQASATTEMVSEQELRIGSGTTKRIDIELGAPRLNARGRLLHEESERARAEADRRDALEAGRLRTAADAGDTEAMVSLAQAYRVGRGVPASEEQASIWERKAAEAGHPKVMAQLARSAERKRDFAEAFFWYERLAARGDAVGEAGLGSMYYNGTGVAKDAHKALALWRKAAEAGNARAMNGIGVIHLFGAAGLPKDEAVGLQWIQKASDAGEPRAHMNLAGRYRLGADGLPKDPVRAAKLLELAADAGEIQAMVALAYMNEKGEGIPQDNNKALALTRRGVELGDPAAMNALGGYYADGRAGLQQDDASALSWFRKAAALGNEDAQKNIGVVAANARTRQAMQQAAAQQLAAQQPAASSGPGIGGGLLGGLVSHVMDRNIAKVNSAVAGTGVAGSVVANVTTQLSTQAKEAAVRDMTGTEEGRQGYAIASALAAGRTGSDAFGARDGSQGAPAQASAAATAGQGSNASGALQACSSVSYPGSKSDPQVYTYDAIAQFDACAYRATGDERYVVDGNRQCKVLAGLIAATGSTFRPLFCSGPLMKR